MISNRYILGACAAMALVLPGFGAMADGTKPAAPAANSAAPAASSAAPAATPTPAASTPAQAQAIPAAAQKWAKFCDKAPDGHNICIVRKLVVDNGRIVGSMLLRIDTANAGKILAVAAAPVGVVLTPGLNWQIDTAKASAHPFWRCTPQMCESQWLVDTSFINALKRGKSLKLTAKTIQDKDFVIDVSLNGFTAAFDMKDAPTFQQYSKSLGAK